MCVFLTFIHFKLVLNWHFAKPMASRLNTRENSLPNATFIAMSNQNVKHTGVCVIFTLVLRKSSM